MDRFVYIKIHRRQIPAEIILEYNLHNEFDAQGYIYFEIMKGMYGLKQAGACPVPIVLRDHSW